MKNTDNRRHDDLLDDIDRLSLKNYRTVTDKIAPLLRKTYGADTIAEWTSTADRIFVSEAFIHDDSLKACIASLARDVCEHDKDIDIDALVIPSIADSGLFHTRAEICARIIVESARKGGRGLDVIVAAYKAFYPQEYKVLKKFRKISFSEIMALSEMDDDDGYDFNKISRFLLMSEFMGIGYADDIILIFQLLADNADNGFSERFGTVEQTAVHYPEDIDTDTITSEIHSLTLDPDAGKAFDFCQEIITFGLTSYGFPEYFIEHAFYDMGRDLQINYPRAISTAYCIMHNAEFGPEFTGSAEFTGIAAALVCLLNVFCNYVRISQGDFLRISGMIRYDDPDAFLPDVRYSVPPERGSRSPEPQKSPARDVLSEKVGEGVPELIAQVSELKDRLRTAKAREKSLHAELEEERRAAAELRRLAVISDSERTELYALREFVHSLDSEDDAEDAPLISADAMKTELKKKKAVIIGGNPNWVKKIRYEFPAWEFIPADAKGSTTGSFAGADMVYFFTDTMAHTCYAPFIRMCRDQKIRYGYLHGVNIDNNIRKIYNELCTQ